MFIDANRDGLSEYMFLFSGGALTSGPGVGSILYHWLWSQPSVPLGVLEVLQIAVLVACLAIAATIGIVAHKRGSKVTTLANELRARHQTAVNQAGSQVYNFPRKGQVP